MNRSKIKFFISVLASILVVLILSSIELEKAYAERIFGKKRVVPSDYGDKVEPGEDVDETLYLEFWKHKDKAQIYMKLGRYEEALAEYQEMIRIDPKHELAYNQIEFYYAKTERSRPLIPEEEEAREENVKLMLENLTER